MSFGNRPPYSTSGERRQALLLATRVRENSALFVRDGKAEGDEMTSLERKIQEWARTANLDGDLRPAIERAARELVALVREETLVEILSEIDAKFQKVPRAHTYASENEIGRASCRERVKIQEVGGGV